MPLKDGGMLFELPLVYLGLSFYTASLEVQGNLG